MKSICPKQEELKNLQLRFLSADLCDQIHIVHKTAFIHSRFQHYTSLDNMLKMIRNKEMWLTRSNSLTLDDWNESKKFGTEAQHRRTYIGCFSYHVGESAAMWRMYCSPNAHQIKVSIPCNAMQEWIQYLEANTDKMYAAELIHGQVVTEEKPLAIQSVEFTDLLYASIKGNGVGEKSRDGRIRWMGVMSEQEYDKPDVAIPMCTAKMKDVEWDFEEESRLIVTMAKQKDCATVRRIRVPLTEKLIASMAFTLSPWVPEEEVASYRAVIRNAVRKSVDAKLLGNGRPNPYRSTLCGALGRLVENRYGK